MAEISWEEWVAELQRSMPQEASEGITTPELAEATKMTERRVRGLLKAGKARGMVESVQVWRKQLDNAVRRVPGYILLKPEVAA